MQTLGDLKFVDINSVSAQVKMKFSQLIRDARLNHPDARLRDHISCVFRICENGDVYAIARICGDGMRLYDTILLGTVGDEVVPVMQKETDTMTSSTGVRSSESMRYYTKYIVPNSFACSWYTRRWP